MITLLAYLTFAHRRTPRVWVRPPIRPAALRRVPPHSAPLAETVRYAFDEAWKVLSG